MERYVEFLIARRSRTMAEDEVNGFVSDQDADHRGTATAEYANADREWNGLPDVPAASHYGDRETETGHGRPLDETIAPTAAWTPVRLPSRTTRTSCQTFRTDLFGDGYDNMRSVEKSLGHRKVAATVTFTHSPTRGALAIRSPLHRLSRSPVRGEGTTDFESPTERRSTERGAWPDARGDRR